MQESEEASGDESKAHVSDTVLKVLLAPWNQPSGANWEEAYWMSFWPVAYQAAAHPVLRTVTTYCKMLRLRLVCAPNSLTQLVPIVFILELVDFKAALLL